MLPIISQLGHAAPVQASAADSLSKSVWLHVLWTSSHLGFLIPSSMVSSKVDNGFLERPSAMQGDTAESCGLIGSLCSARRTDHPTATRETHCLFPAAWKCTLICNSTDTEWVTARDLDTKSHFSTKTGCKWITPKFSLSAPVLRCHFLFEFYGRVKLMNAFLKRKTLQGLAQAKRNYSKSFVKLNCNNIANAI